MAARRWSRMSRLYPTLLTVCLGILTSDTATPDGGTECNGHGVVGSNSTQLCLCESPYTGDHCQFCIDGYYGDPRRGMPCYLSCQDSKLLRQFTYAGVGVNPLNNPPKQLHSRPYCVWIIAPDLSSSHEFQTSAPLSVTSSHPGSTSWEALLMAGNKRVNNTSEFLLQFISSPVSTLSGCFSEGVLIYTGLPTFLNFTVPNTFIDLATKMPSFPFPETNSSNLVNGTRNVENGTQNVENVSSKVGLNVRTNLVASFTGEQLLNASLSVSSSLLTVVYLHHGLSHHQDNALALHGFNLSVRVTKGKGEESHDKPNGNETRDNQSECPISTNCIGRYWHSAVFESSKSSLWLYGGLDMSGIICTGVLVINVSMTMVATEMEIDMCGDGMRLVVPTNDSDWPAHRYLHTATHYPCVDALLDGGCMLVFGGFPSTDMSHGPSRELWQYDGRKENWKRLEDAPEGFGAAGHAAVMVSNSTMLVIGGVGDGLTVSEHVLSYDVRSMLWDVWERETLGLSGVFGHEVIYDSKTDSVYLFGGSAHSRSRLAISSSLLILDVQTRHWSKVLLTSQPSAVIFHSMVLVNRTLVVYGGLALQHPPLTLRGEGLEDLCVSDEIVLVDLDSECRGKLVVSISSQSVFPTATKLWGHSATSTNENQIFVAGGFNGTAVNSLFVFSPPLTISCSLAQSPEQCSSLPDCVICSPMPGGDYQGCYNLSDTSLSSVCARSNLDIQPSTINCDSRNADEVCSRFHNCETCLSTNVAQDANCVWCGCDKNRCMTNCSCNDVAQNYTTVREVCPFDFCNSASCRDCLSQESCGWTFIKITPTSVDQSRFLISPEASEWGCYQNIINVLTSNRLGYQTTFGVCPRPCSTTRTCRECVEADSPLAGDLKCVWSRYNQACSSMSLIPLICPTGLCGELVTTEEKCPLPCVAHSDCRTCLQDPACVWYVSYAESAAVGFCSDIVSHASNLSALSAKHVRAYYTECSRCVSDCSGHGVCELANLTCSCDLGFIGEDCSVECECNGLSYCANETEAGRRHCLMCEHNTQGSSCNKCKPFSVGTPGNGNGCVPCSDYCYGNSDICMREQELQEALNRNTPLNRTELLEIISSGPEEVEAVCASCERSSTGERCDMCSEGYYINSHGTDNSIVTCEKCPCNGHGGCQGDTGVCSCQNNTRSILCEGDLPCLTTVQCSQCVPGYTGIPLNNNQCYLQLNMNQTANFTLLNKRSIPISIRLDCSLDIDAQLTFMVEYGDLQVYESVSNRAVYVEVDTDTQEHSVRVRPDFQLTSRVKRTSQDLSLGKESVPFEFSKRIFSRQILSESFEQPKVTLHHISSNRHSWNIPYGNFNCPSGQYFLTVFALSSVGAKFFVYYQQDSPQINHYVFFGVFICSFIFTFSLVLVICKFCTLCKIGWARRQARLQEARRRNIPFTKVSVHFDRNSVGTDLEKTFRKVDIREEACDLFTRPKPRSRRTSSETIPQGIELQPSIRMRHKVGKFRPEAKVVNLDDVTPWPLAQQPTAVKGFAVYGLIVKLPTKHKSTGAHLISFGSTLMVDPNVAEEKKKLRLIKSRRASTNPTPLEVSML